MDDNRIILIRGNNSEWYEQAIFILKSPIAAKGKNLVLEAEKIINDYMTSGRVSLLSPKLERYKNNASERAATKKQLTGQTEPAVKNGAAVAASRKKPAAQKHDYVTLFIGVCLVVSCILFGYIMHRIVSP